MFVGFSSQVEIQMVVGSWFRNENGVDVVELCLEQLNDLVMFVSAWSSNDVVCGLLS